MAIGLPPIDVDLSSTFVGHALPAASTEMRLPLGNTVLRVHGVHLLSTSEVDQALADADERAGWRNVLVVMHRPGEQILVIRQTGLSEVLEVEPVTVYFRLFIGPAPIRRSAFAIAGRTGADATARCQRPVEVPEKWTRIGGDEVPASPTLDYPLRLGNDGNRFVGHRYRGNGADNTALGMSIPEMELQTSSFHAGLQGERFIHMSPHWRWSLGAGAACDRYRIRQLGTRASAAETHADLQVRQSLFIALRGTGATGDFRVGGVSSGISTSLFGADRLSLTHELQWSQDALPQSEQWPPGGFDRDRDRQAAGARCPAAFAVDQQEATFPARALRAFAAM
jgi:hypothetical protein